jgi:hypothetical protein
MSLLFILTGCAAGGTYETARTAPYGGFQAGGAINFATVERPIDVINERGENLSSFLFYFYPFTELSFKYGVADNFDIGARWVFGPGITAKYQFLNAGTEGAISMYSWLYYYYLSAGGERETFISFGLEPRIIISNEQPGGFPYSLNAGLNCASSYVGVAGVEGTGMSITAVGGVGLPIRVGATRCFRIMPELSASVPLVNGRSALSLGVGFTYTGQDEKSGNIYRRGERSLK